MTESRLVEDWWAELTDQQRYYLAAQAAGADPEVLYAISKPWKYVAEAWKIHCKEAAERGEVFDLKMQQWRTRQ